MSRFFDRQNLPGTHRIHRAIQRNGNILQGQPIQSAHDENHALLFGRQVLQRQKDGLGGFPARRAGIRGAGRVICRRPESGLGLGRIHALRGSARRAPRCQPDHPRNAEEIAGEGPGGAVAPPHLPHAQEGFLAEIGCRLGIAAHAVKKAQHPALVAPPHLPHAQEGFLAEIGCRLGTAAHAVKKAQHPALVAPVQFFKRARVVRAHLQHDRNVR